MCPLITRVCSVDSLVALHLVHPCTPLRPAAGAPAHLSFPPIKSQALVCENGSTRGDNDASQPKKLNDEDCLRCAIFTHDESHNDGSGACLMVYLAISESHGVSRIFLSSTWQPEGVTMTMTMMAMVHVSCHTSCFLSSIAYLAASEI